MSVSTQTERPRICVKVRRVYSPSTLHLRSSVAKVLNTPSNGNSLRVPVVAPDGQPLMPCTPRRARKLMEAGKATPFWSKGIFCIKMVVEPSGRDLQPVVIGVDPGSKKEGISVVSHHTDLLHIQLDARTQVKDKIKNRRELRRSRRNRNTPCRAPRWNRASLRKNRIPPSTKARWDWKLRNIKRLAKIYPITNIVVEDIKAVTKNYQNKWNVSFSPLEIGKAWFYDQVGQIALLATKQGWETKTLRERYGLKKSSQKLAETFEAHCVDSWVLAADALGVNRQPNLKKLLCIVPLDFRRRSLHLQTPGKSGQRRRHGGTRNAGLRKGTLILDPKLGLTYLGGASKNRVSLHSLETGTRITVSGDVSKCKVLGYNSVRWHTK